MSTAIALKNIAVRFGEVTALEDVTVDIADRSFVALIGPNGSGKTTLLNVLMGLQKPSAGTVRVFGGPPGALPPGRLGYIPQVKTLQRDFPARVIELVATGLKPAWPWRLDAATREQAMEALSACGIAHLAMRPVGRLSGGELQRAFVARSLVRRPGLLLLDEPAAGMDLAAEAALYHLLLHYQREHDCTIIMITHDWEGARAHASHALLLNRRVLAHGPAAEVASERALLDLFGHRGHVQATH